MEKDRRSFLQSAGALGGAALFLPGSLITQAQTFETLDRGYYDARRKEWFYLHTPDAAHQGQLRLIRVESELSRPGVEAFSLFLGSRRYAEQIPAGFYEVSGEPFDLNIQFSRTYRGKHYYLAHFALLAT